MQTATKLENAPLVVTLTTWFPAKVSVILWSVFNCQMELFYPVSLSL